MKKFAVLFLALCLACICAAASAQTFHFEKIHADLEVSGSQYVLLTPDNLDLHESWVRSSGSTKEELITTWNEQGVLLIAETNSGDARLIVKAVEDADAITYYDLDQQVERNRKHWAQTFKDNTCRLSKEGYVFSSATWKDKKQYGNLLNLKYKKNENGTTIKGLMRACIRNGYTITLDYQVKGRNIKTADTKAFETIVSTFVFQQILEKPASCTPDAVMTSEPPLESSSGKFTVAGTCDPNLNITAVVTRATSGDHLQYDTVASKDGKFEIDVVLPKEGVWLTTLTIATDVEVVQELVLSTTTYDATQLPVAFTSEIPTELHSNTLEITGVTIKGVQVQCMLGTGYDKIVTTNGTGKFTFKVPVKTEGEYDLTIVFQKKGYDTRRYTYKINRSVDESEVRREAINNAVKPAYSTLTKKLSGYTGKTMKYKVYIVEVQQKDDQWIVSAAMARNKDGSYKNFIVITTEEEPEFEADTEQLMFGVCTGAINMNIEGLEKTYPSFKLLFWNQ